MMLGINCHQTPNYLKFVAKADPIPTRIWLSVVMVANAASVFHQVYINRVYSLGYFDIGFSILGSSIGDGVILYSVVTM